MVDVTKVEVVSPKPTGESVRRRNANPVPETPFEVTNDLIRVHTGHDLLNPTLERMYKIVHRVDNENVAFDANDLFGTLNPDVRLGNLRTDAEMEYVRWALKQHLMDMQLLLPKAAALSNALIASVVEPSLSWNMALRNNLQTVRQESEHVQIEQTPKKKSIISSLFKTNG